MSFKKHIHEVTEKFFLSTHIPIQAFQLDGEHIYCAGYNGKFNRLFDNQNIYEKMKAKMFRDDEPSMTTISCSDNIHFTACPICPRNIHRGIFILGPYSSCENNHMGVAYKPISLMPDLVSFLDIICKGCSNSPRHTLDCVNYGLHVKKAIDYIDARYVEPITLADVSDYLNISKSYFCLLFKEETNKTFTEFLNNIRVEKSKELLLEGNLSMLDIALSVGFNNQNYYNIMFKKITNKTPSEFRKGD